MYQTLLRVSLESIKENTNIDFSTPKKIYDWMEHNLKYNGVSKEFLLTPDEVLETKKAHCWESCSLEYKLLTKLGFKCNIIYLENKDCSATHSLVYYIDNNKYFWFEWAWGKYKGIREYKTKNDLISDVINKFKKDNGFLFCTEGHTVIKKDTKQIDYYDVMASKWKEVLDPFDK